MIIIKKASIATLIFLCFAFSINSQKKVPNKVEVKPTKDVVDATSHSLTYMLPQTTINVEIEMEKIIKKAGPYYRYSQRYLNLNNVITKDSEEWIIKGVKIYTTGKADESKRYSIFTKGITSANMVSLTSEGVFLGINNNDIYEAQSADFDNQLIPSLDDISFDNVALNEELLYKTSTAAMAQEAANMVYKLRTSRIELLTGESENTPPDGEAYKAILKEIKKQEKDFVSLFAGRTISVTQTKTFKVTPNPLSSYANHVLCRFNKQKGLVDAIDITGTPIYLKMDIEKLKRLENNRTEELKEPIKNGLYYNLPAKAVVNIVDKNTPIGSQKVDLAQYGQVISMSPSILEKEGIVIKICPVTGALISIYNEQ